MSEQYSTQNDAPLILSVSGVRGIVGETMTQDVARRFATAFGTYLKSTTDNRTVILGRDSRPSGESFTLAVCEGLNSLEFEVVDLGVVMTPTVGLMIQKKKAAGGMVITASHNPIQWNGLKCLNETGAAPTADETTEIINLYHECETQDIPKSERRNISDDINANHFHITKVLSHVKDNAIRNAGFKVVLDSINGAGCEIGKALLENLGCEVIHINAEPTGDFAHTPEPIAENLTQLCQAVKDNNAHIGFAQDPDGDRLAIVDEGGTFIGEEYTLALCVKLVLEREPDKGGILATNLSTSRMIDDIAADYPNTKVIRTPVGEANVVAAMQQHGENAIIGGEGNGGVIYPPVCWVRDSLSSMALILDLLSSDLAPVSELVNEIPRYTMIKKKFGLSKVGGKQAIPEILKRVKTEFANEKINDSDGVRIDFPDGWIHIRPSNTEPIMRIIAEGRTETDTHKLIDSVKTAASF